MDEEGNSTADESTVSIADKNNLATSKILSKRRVGNYIYQLVAVPQGSTTGSQATNNEGGTDPAASNKALEDTSGGQETLSEERNRTPKFRVPAHILGRNLDSPEPDGKRKPRPGVRVPNLTLTSQILSKEELYREVAQRGTRTQQQNLKGDPLLPKKLTDCLAGKLGKASESNITASPTLADDKDSTDTELNISTSSATLLSTTSKQSLLDLMRKEYVAGLTSTNTAVSEKPTPSNNAGTDDMDIEAAIAALHGEPLVVAELENETALAEAGGDKAAEIEPREKQQQQSPKRRSSGNQTSVEIKRQNVSTFKKRKRASNELNQLFIDEGAINMLREMERSGRASRRSGSGEILQSLIPKELLATKTLKTIKKTPGVLKRRPAVKKKRMRLTDSAKTAHHEANELADKGPTRWESLKTTHSPDADGDGVVFVTRKLDNPAEASQIIRRRSCSWSSDEDLEGPETPKKTSKTHERLINGSCDVNQDYDRASAKARQDHDALNLKEVQLKYMDGYAHVILSQKSTAKLQNALTIAVLVELQQIFEALNKNDAVDVVLLTSVGPAFCHGVDVSSLLAQSQEEVDDIAKKTAQALTKFLKELNHFEKILIAGINGCTVGVGVTMLPFFDVVYASEKATFCLPYARLGQTTEGAVAATFTQLGAKRLASSMLYEGRRLTAMEAERFGLVSAILWPSRFHEDLIPRVKQIAGQSATAMLAMKAAQNEALRPAIDSLLERESELLVNSWTSADFQRRACVYLDNFDDNL